MTRSVPSSVEPRRRNLTFSHASRASRRREIMPAPRGRAGPVEARTSRPSASGRGRRTRRPFGTPFAMDACRMTASPWPPPRADRRAAEAAAAPAQLVDERAEDAGARGADRVAERDGAAVDVDAVLVDAEHPDRVQRHRGERLVDLPQVDVARLQARLVQRLLAARGRRRGEVGEVVGATARGRRSRRATSLPLAAAHSSEATTSAPPPSLTPGELPAVCEPSLPTRPGSLASALERRAAARALVDLDDRVALPALDGHGDDLLGHAALVDRLERAARGERSAQRSRSGRVSSSSSPISVASSNIWRAAERVGQAVVDHRVERLGVAHAVAEARLGQQVRRAATSTPCRRRRRPRRRRRGSPGRGSPWRAGREAQTLLMVSRGDLLGDARP